MEMSRIHPWLLLVYKIPREPSGNRVFVWRTLKQLGAVLLHDSVWVLPRLPWTTNRLQVLVAEIAELGGEATLWESRLREGDRRALIQKFVAAADASYRDLLSELEKAEANLEALGHRYEQIRNTDYFDSSLGQEVQARLHSLADRAARAEL
jgi:hypothetical protein